MRYVVLGTAGHIDHGKTTLIKALTGIDTDRLREEKERGITIDLGFAHLDLPNGLRVGIVDVPGHEKFVRNMVAGAWGIDLVLLVVAADEGIMPQTKEHLEICELLGVSRGLVAITKVDMVEPEMAELCAHEVEDFLKGTFLEGAPVVQVSSVTGKGLDLLLKEIERLCSGIPSRSHDGVFRLPVDRAFIMKGFGVVITGTAISGSVAIGDEVEILPLHKVPRIRGIQVHGSSVDKAYSGQRVAINFKGIEKEEIERGFQVVTPGHLRESTFMDLHLRLVGDAPKLKDLTPVHFHCGTANVVGRVKILSGKPVMLPGEGGFVRIHLDSPVVAAPQDPFVVRRFSPVVTIGGGRVIDSNPGEERLSRAKLLERLEKLYNLDDTGRIEAFLSWAGERGMPLEKLMLKVVESHRIRELLKRLGDRIVEVEGHLFHREGVDSLKKKVEGFLKEFFESNPLEQRCSREVLAQNVWQGDPKIFNGLLEVMAKEAAFEVSKEGVKLKTPKKGLSQEAQKGIAMVLAMHRRAGLTPPSVKEIVAKTKLPEPQVKAFIKLLLDTKRLVRVSRDYCITKEAANDLIRRVQGFFSNHSEMRVSDFKEVAGGVSRKYAVPLLEFLDGQGVTYRAGDVRKLRKRD